jgi:transposase
VSIIKESSFLLNAQSRYLDHLGLVASVVDDLGLVERIDKYLPVSDRSKLSMGQRVKAFILNGLGFTDYRLYMVSHFFEGKPVERLIGEGIKAEDLNDDCLGRCLYTNHMKIRILQVRYFDYNVHLKKQK